MNQYIKNNQNTERENKQIKGEMEKKSERGNYAWKRETTKKWKIS
jgi:hypothetical protein